VFCSGGINRHLNRPNRLHLGARRRAGQSAERALFKAEKTEDFAVVVFVRVLMWTLPLKEVKVCGERLWTVGKFGVPCTFMHSCRYCVSRNTRLMVVAAFVLF